MNECMERLKNGIITENPVFIMALGLCPTFAVTTNATNANPIKHFFIFRSFQSSSR